MQCGEPRDGGDEHDGGRHGTRHDLNEDVHENRRQRNVLAQKSAQIESLRRVVLAVLRAVATCALCRALTMNVHPTTNQQKNAPTIVDSRCFSVEPGRTRWNQPANERTYMQADTHSDQRPLRAQSSSARLSPLSHCGCVAPDRWAQRRASIRAIESDRTAGRMRPTRHQSAATAQNKADET